MPFADGGEVSSFAVEAMDWAVENGLVNGLGDGNPGASGPVYQSSGRKGDPLLYPLGGRRVIPSGSKATLPEAGRVAFPP